MHLFKHNKIQKQSDTSPKIYTHAKKQRNKYRYEIKEAKIQIKQRMKSKTKETLKRSHTETNNPIHKGTHTYTVYHRVSHESRSKLHEINTKHHKHIHPNSYT